MYKPIQIIMHLQILPLFNSAFSGNIIIEECFSEKLKNCSIYSKILFKFVTHFLLRNSLASLLCCILGRFTLCVSGVIQEYTWSLALPLGQAGSEDIPIL